MPESIKTERKISPRKAPSQKRSKVKVEAILKATEGLLASEGLEKLTTNHIAKAAEMSVGSLYQYFPNKQSIIYELYKRWLDGVHEDIEAVTQKVDPADGWDSAIDSMFDGIYGPMTEQIGEHRFEQELSKAMELYPELKEMDRIHGRKIAVLMAGFWKQLGLKASDSQLLELGAYVYALDSALDHAMSQGVKPETALECHKLAVRAVLKPFQ